MSLNKLTPLKFKIFVHFLCNVLKKYKIANWGKGERLHHSFWIFRRYGKIYFSIFRLVIRPNLLWKKRKNSKKKLKKCNVDFLETCKFNLGNFWKFLIFPPVNCKPSAAWTRRTKAFLRNSNRWHVSVPRLHFRIVQTVGYKNYCMLQYIKWKRTVMVP